GARSSRSEPAEMLASDSGKSTLFSLFVLDTMPVPRADKACDNSRIPVASWGGPQTEASVWNPVTGRLESVPTWPCLNQPPIAGPTPQDPAFVVTGEDGANRWQPSLAMRMPGDGALTSTVHVAGDWLIDT